jgi:hypothetical protein
MKQAALTDTAGALSTPPVLTVMRLMCALVVVVLPGCGLSHYAMDETPKQSLKNFDVLEIRDFTSTLNDPDSKEIAMRFADKLHAELLEDRALNPAQAVFEEVVRSTDRTDKVLVLEGAVISFDKGSRAKRYWLGFGPGAVLCTIQSTFTDKATGDVVHEVDFDGKHMQGGPLGGKPEEVMNWLARAYIGYFRDYFGHSKRSTGLERARQAPSAPGQSR